jgi:hypothetical protein
MFSQEKQSTAEKSVPDYCLRENREAADCRICAMINNGKDCRNQPVAGYTEEVVQNEIS